MQLREQLHGLRAKAKQWATQTRISAQGEAKILLTKVDAVANQINQIEKSHHDARRQIVGLQDSRRDLQAQLAAMVPVSELQAARAEAGKLREAMDGLNQLLHARQEETERLKSAIQVKPGCSDRLCRVVLLYDGTGAASC